MIAEQKVNDILASFADPVAGVDLLAANRVEAVVISDTQLIVTLAIPASLAEKYQPVVEPLTAALREAAPGQSVQVILTADRLASSTAKPSVKPQGIDTSKMKNIIAVASGKGGVGKSTVAVNLAAALAAAGHRVGLLDADIYGPSVPRLLKINDKPVLNDAKKFTPPVVGYENAQIKAMSIGLLVDAESALIWRGPMVQGAIVQMLRDVEWGDLDYMIIDMPPGTGDAQLTLAQQVKLTGAVIVSTPQDIALIDARKAVAMFQKVGVPILGIVENMSVFCCPNCGHETAIFGAGGAKAEAHKLGVPLLAELPLVAEVRAMSDDGAPPAWYGDEATKARYADLAAAVVAG